MTRIIPIPDDGTLRQLANLLELRALASYNDLIDAQLHAYYSSDTSRLIATHEHRTTPPLRNP